MLINGSALNTTAINGEAELSIYELCDIARSRVESDAQSEINADVFLKAIDKDALEEARIWRRKYHSLGKQSHEPGWDWKKEFYTRGRRSSHIDLAIWHDGKLCGMMIGQVSDGRVNATIHFMEGDPDGNPLKGSVVDIATRFLEAIAALLDCQFAVISRPIPELVDFYKSHGYTIEELKRKTVKALKKQMPALQLQLENG